MFKEVKEKNKQMDLRTAIVLCNIVDDFEKFNTELKKIMSGGNSRTNIYRLYRLSIAEKIKDVMANKELIKFYLQNEEIINKIKKHCTLDDFISNNYTQEGNISELSCIGEVYDYLNKHKEDQEKILELFYKLKDLGFNNIIFDEKLDFTTDKYSINSIFNYNEEIVYLDNIEIIPNYDFGVVEYRSEDSNYKMKLKTLYFDFLIGDRTIYLNSLLFDLDKLPKKIDMETIFDSIISLKEEKKDQYNKITNSVNFSVKIDDLSNEFYKLNNVVDKLDTITTTKEIKEVLKSIKELLEDLKNKSKEYDSSITEERNITLESLKFQKNKFLEKRRMSKEDCC